MLTGREDVEPDLLGLERELVIDAMRSASDAARPVVGSMVTSPTLKMPNCMMSSSEV